ncbi:MAG TPA: phosphate acyltransferase [Candidatus Omnitrophota bacterium]|nr:phosphate acyltransferase [Candidatus Omnitrophota bacterium]HPT07723.1 phosphate acyltransferase [Candidatus Omnitrophota bacterium]
MDTISRLREKARAQKKRIALPEYNDARVKEAYAIIQKEGIADVTLLTPERVNPEDKERYIQEFYELRKSKGVSLEAVRKQFEDTLWPAAMMTRDGKFDGFVAGAAHTTADMARSAIHCLGISDRITIACSCFIMAIPDCPYGQNGTFIFADCGIIPDPNSRQLACIALAASDLAAKLLDIPPRVAFLSYSTKGSAQSKSAEKIAEAKKVLLGMAPDLMFDGEMQADAALVPDVGRIKDPGGRVAGKANVLVFPNLDAGNISYKLVERLARARAVGPILLGLNKPCSDLSRGCSADDVVDCTAITAIRAQ